MDEQQSIIEKKPSNADPRVPEELADIDGIGTLVQQKNIYELSLNQNERTNGFKKPLGCP